MIFWGEIDEIIMIKMMTSLIFSLVEGSSNVGVGAKSFVVRSQKITFSKNRYTDVFRDFLMTSFLIGN